MLPSIWVFTQVADERTRYSILISAAVSALGFLLTLRLIPLTKAYTLKAGLFGLDINKKGSREGEKKVPESLGLASGVVFLVSAAARLHDLSYSRFIEGLHAANIGLDRKVLSDLAIRDEVAFTSVVNQVKAALKTKAAALAAKA